MKTTILTVLSALTLSALTGTITFADQVKNDDRLAIGAQITASTGLRPTDALKKVFDEKGRLPRAEELDGSWEGYSFFNYADSTSAVMFGSITEDLAPVFSTSAKAVIFIGEAGEIETASKNDSSTVKYLLSPLNDYGLAIPTRGDGRSLKVNAGELYGSFPTTAFAADRENKKTFELRAVSSSKGAIRLIGIWRANLKDGRSISGTPPCNVPNRVAFSDVCEAVYFVRHKQKVTPPIAPMKPKNP